VSAERVEWGRRVAAQGDKNMAVSGLSHRKAMAGTGRAILT